MVTSGNQGQYQITPFLKSPLPPVGSAGGREGAGAGPAPVRGRIAAGTSRQLVALTGIEPGDGQSSSVQFGLSSCGFGLVQFATRQKKGPTEARRAAPVLPRDPKNRSIRSALLSAPGPGPSANLRRTNKFPSLYLNEEGS